MVVLVSGYLPILVIWPDRMAVIVVLRNAVVCFSKLIQKMWSALREDLVLLCNLDTLLLYPQRIPKDINLRLITICVTDCYIDCDKCGHSQKDKEDVEMFSADIQR